MFSVPPPHRIPYAVLEAILPSVASGDPRAVEQCLDRYGGLVWSFARRYFARPADAEDAVQEAFLSLWANARRFDPADASERAFVATIARRRVFELLSNGAGDDAADLAAPEGDDDAPVPHLLRERLLDDAAEFDFDNDQEDRRDRSGAAASAETNRREWPVYTMMAVAAGVLLSLWMGEPTRSPSAERRSLIASADDLVQIAWAPQDDPSVGEPAGEAIAGDVSNRDAPYGDVVWSDRLQRGYLRVRGLRANDPSVEQYQLWVFDAERDDRYPVDGGVFNVAPSADEQVASITAKLPVTKGVQFAVTVEKPGGVVVSDRQRLALLARR